MFRNMYSYTCTYMPVTTTTENRGHGLKGSKEGYMGRFGDPASKQGGTLKRLRQEDYEFQDILGLKGKRIKPSNMSHTIKDVRELRTT